MPNISLSYPNYQQNVTVIAHKPTRYYFWLFLLLHSLLWTIGPAMLRASLPHDTLEGISWGLQWQWGYSKHPFFTAWLCAAASRLGGTVGWPIYLLAQIAISLTFWAVWQLARQMLSAIPALVATLLLEGVLFYNINSFNLTPDTMQSPIWALLTLFFYSAVCERKVRYWLLSGVFAALAVLTKYQAALILLSLFAFSLVNRQARHCYREGGIWLAFGLFGLLIAPHLHWLYLHDMITIHYALFTPGEYSDLSIKAHVIYPLRLILNSLGNIAPLLLLALPFYRFRTKSPAKNRPFNAFNQQFLLFAGLGPWLLTLLLCILSGDRVPSRWLTPYFFLTGIMLFHVIPLPLTRKQLKQFTILLVILSTLLFGGRMLTFSQYARPHSDAFLPNQSIATHLQQLWQEKYHRPLPYLAGSHYLVALVTPYFQQPPHPFFSWDTRESPWINEQDMRRQGAIFIWDRKKQFVWDAKSRQFSQIPAAVWARYPTLQRQPDLTVPRLHKTGESITIGVAILPPQK